MLSLEFIYRYRINLLQLIIIPVEGHPQDSTTKWWCVCMYVTYPCVGSPVNIISPLAWSSEWYSTYNSRSSAPLRWHYCPTLQVTGACVTKRSVAYSPKRQITFFPKVLPFNTHTNTPESGNMAQPWMKGQGFLRCSTYANAQRDLLLQNKSALVLWNADTMSNS